VTDNHMIRIMSEGDGEGDQWGWWTCDEWG